MTRTLSLEDFARETGGVTTAQVDGHIHAGLRSMRGKRRRARYEQRASELQDARDATRAAYDAAVERGEIAPEPKTTLEEIATWTASTGRAAAARRLIAKRRALIEARQNNPNESVNPTMMTTHYDTALQFIATLDSGKLGTSAEDRAGALAVVLAGAVAGSRAAAADDSALRAGLESIRDETEVECEEGVPLTTTRNALRFARGVAIRLVGERSTDTSSSATKETNG